MPEHLNTDGERRLGNLEVVVKDMTQRMQAVEAGVANFRMFQGIMAAHKDEVHDFIVRRGEKDKTDEIELSQRRQKQDAKDQFRSRVHFALLTGLITFVVGLGIWLIQWVISGHHFVVSDNITISTQDAKTYAAR